MQGYCIILHQNLNWTFNVFHSRRVQILFFDYFYCRLSPQGDKECQSQLIISSKDVKIFTSVFQKIGFDIITLKGNLQYFSSWVVIVIFIIYKFFTLVLMVVFHWSLKYSKSFRTILSILADLNSAVVWIVLILPLISSSTSLFSRPFRTVPNVPTRIGTIFTCMFHSLFSFLAKSKLFIFFIYFYFSMVFWDGRIH